MNPSPALAELNWQQVVRTYRAACVLHRQAPGAESQRVLEQDLAESILTWAECDAADGATQTQRLEAMFQQERQRVEDAWFAQELMRQRWHSELLPALSVHIGEEVRKAVRTLPAARPVAMGTARGQPTPAPMRARPEARPARPAAGDIASIIDLLLEQECAATPHQSAA
jgi:hypothetical protein